MDERVRDAREHRGKSKVKPCRETHHRRKKKDVFTSCLNNYYIRKVLNMSVYRKIGYAYPEIWGILICVREDWKREGSKQNLDKSFLWAKIARGPFWDVPAQHAFPPSGTRGKRSFLVRYKSRRRQRLQTLGSFLYLDMR